MLVAEVVDGEPREVAHDVGREGGAGALCAVGRVQGKSDQQLQNQWANETIEIECSYLEEDLRPTPPDLALQQRPALCPRHLLARHERVEPGGRRRLFDVDG